MGLQTNLERCPSCWETLALSETSKQPLCGCSAAEGPGLQGGVHLGQPHGVNTPGMDQDRLESKVARGSEAAGKFGADAC
jgi:hypothetical protein